MTERIREQSDAGLTLTESLMKVRGVDWLGVHSDEVCHSDSCRGDLGLQRTGSDSSGIFNWLHGWQPDSAAHIWTRQHTVFIGVKRTRNEVGEREKKTESEVSYH